MENKDNRWHCPLLKKIIDEGYCLDINYQRKGYFQDDVLSHVKLITKMDLLEINVICDNCVHNPKLL